MLVDITSILRSEPRSPYTRAAFLAGIIALEFALLVVAYATLWGR